jgi:hypothetical protein
MVPIEPWMLRTALVIGTLFLFDIALYVLHRRLQRRNQMERKERRNEIAADPRRWAFGPRFDDAPIFIPQSTLIH